MSSEFAVEMHGGRWKRYPAYRDSGVEWLGEVPEGWAVKRLKHLCSFSALYGANESATSYVDEGVRFLRTTDINDKGELLLENAVFLEREQVKDYILEDGDILLSRSGTIGRSFVHDASKHGQCAYAGYLVRFVTNEKLHPNFAFYYTKTDRFSKYLSLSVIQSTIGNVNGQKYANMPLPTPSILEQRTIATFLDRETGRIDTLIEKKERQIELLQEKRAALISHAVTKGLDPDVKMKDSGVEWLGKMPEHWEVNRIATVFRQRDERGRDDLPVLSVSLNTGVEERDFSNNRIQPKMSDYSQYKITYSGDIVFNKMRMWQGAVGVAPCDGFVSPDYTVAVPFQDVCSKFYEYLFRTRAFTAEVMRYSHGIALDRNRLYWDGFKQIKVPVMTFSEQNEISSYLGRTIGGIDILSSKIQESISKLREYRTALISAAVTGKIDVRQEVMT